MFRSCDEALTVKSSGRQYPELIDASLVSNVGPATLSKKVGFAPIVVLLQEFR
jgi:hypothetical protein